MPKSPYQNRYIAHQARKRRQVAEGFGVKARAFNDHKTVEAILLRRRSQRVFVSKPIEDIKRERILKAAMTAPNSCNRHGILLKVVRERRDKELLGGLLVGGVGWIHRADTIVLFLADPVAYASPNEREFMHYCDVGFKAMAMWLTAESNGVGACYINPNLVDREVFMLRFGTQPMEGGARDMIFCGALALGHYDKRAVAPERVELKETLL